MNNEPPVLHLVVNVSAARDAASATPNPFEGEMAAGGAQLIIRALQWLSSNVTNREDMEDYTTLVELGLNALEDKVETACEALAACRQARGDHHA